MSIFESARFVRLATVLAVALVLLLSGVVVGAAGGPLIMGAPNSAGITNTSLTTSSTGTALLVTQTSTGTALRGVAANGIAGFFTSANGSGISGVVAANTKYGVFGANDAATFGGGAAVRASGQQNHGVVATTANAAADALRGINTGGGQALDLVVNAGVAPMTVNSDTKVVNLNADLLDGLDSSAFAVAEPEAWHEIAPNDGTLNPGVFMLCSGGSFWENFDAFHNTAAFYKDPFGVVHLKGLVKCPGGTIGSFFPDIFFLPEGYEPAAAGVHATVGNDVVGRVDVGRFSLDPQYDSVRVFMPGHPIQYLSLDGITFRAAP